MSEGAAICQIDECRMLTCCDIGATCSCDGECQCPKCGVQCSCVGSCKCGVGCNGPSSCKCDVGPCSCRPAKSNE
ncbi:metallothionein 20-I isoforms A and B-like [Ylistrum balloti]|uniref:metallothionein 20-I isoforms A and B-like n=1 Tax=Ylistrum balloti TaxID=509963 RepID=UPI002905F43F|nr:metallothionein 20-I isoforms A and B-like [Ylistrum balloti]